MIWIWAGDIAAIAISSFVAYMFPVAMWLPPLVILIAAGVTSYKLATDYLTAAVHGLLVGAAGAGVVWAVFVAAVNVIDYESRGWGDQMGIIPGLIGLASPFLGVFAGLVGQALRR